MSNAKEENDRWIVWTSLGVSIIIIGLWFITYYVLEGKADRGTFGDMFGSINALFSGLAMAGIILTILLQRKELKLQREELRETRSEFEKQNETLRLQRFENTFFSMISVHLEMVESLSSRSFNSTGREIFNALLHPWNTELHNENIQDYSPVNFNRYQETFKKSFNQSILSHYLLSLQSIYNLVITSDLINEGLKENYLSIIKSYISYPERKFLFYYLILGGTINDSTYITLKDMESKIKFIGTVSQYGLIKTSHLKLLEKF